MEPVTEEAKASVIDGLAFALDQAYDVIILGTGLKECILSGIFSVEGKKVLHLDRNPYYGGESASLNLNQMFSRFEKGQMPPSSLGPSKEYNIDLVPKFIMATGTCVDLLVHTRTSRYLDFKVVDGSYVMSSDKVSKVPSTATEALASPLMGLFQKRHVKNFLEYVANWSNDDPKTYKGYDLHKVPMSKLFKDKDIDSNSRDFMGHAMALWQTDDYLAKPAFETVMRLKQYAYSMTRYGKSPYIYPMYGLGDLPQAFARLAAIYGGTYMLNRQIDGFAYNSDKSISGIRCQGVLVKAPIVIADPTYALDMCVSVAKIIRVYCILNHPISCTDGSNSCQIVLPFRQIGRRYDIYISVLNYTHCVAPANMYLATVSTVATSEGDPLKEVEAGMKLLGPILHTFISVSPYYKPKVEGIGRGLYISKSYDPTSHFESTISDVIDMYKRITGSVLKLVIPENEEE